MVAVVYYISQVFIRMLSLDGLLMPGNDKCQPLQEIAINKEL